MFATIFFAALVCVLFFNRKRLSLFRWVKAGHAVVLVNMFGKQRVVVGSSRYSLFFEQETEICWTRSIGTHKGSQIPLSPMVHSVGNRLYRSSVVDVLCAVSHEDPWRELELELAAAETLNTKTVNELKDRYGLRVEQAYAAK